MKTRSYFAAAFCALFAAVLFTSCEEKLENDETLLAQERESILEDENLDEPLTRANSSNGAWMAELDDSTPFARLSIPGTHDAVTGDGTAFSIGRTQSLKLSAQWDLGIRAYDFRPGYRKVRVRAFKYKNELHVYHGVIPTNTTFKAAVKTLMDKIDANPSEFAVVIMQFESDSPFYNDRSVWNSLMCEFLNSEETFPSRFRIDYRPDLTVGDLRGKILLLSRDSYADQPITGGYISGWSFSENGTTGATIKSRVAEGTLGVQDYYHVEDTDAKLNAVSAFMDWASENAGKNCWTINHTSGYTGSISTDNTYRANAANNHPTVYKRLTNGECASTGMIMMDWVGNYKSGSYVVYGDLLPQAIIDNNFR
jgi:hypothetical protein